MVAARTRPPAQVPIPLYEHILSLVDQLSPDERLQLIAHIASSMQSFINDDDDDEELLADAMHVLENTPDDAWIPWEEVKAELMRAEAAGELPD